MFASRLQNRNIPEDTKSQSINGSRVVAVNRANGLSDGVAGRVLEFSLFPFVGKDVLGDSAALLIEFASLRNGEVEPEAGDENDFFRGGLILDFTVFS
jgi:hypothetical protein